jgi:KaiC/GvpD/RAD55 family RecA-like ATPase
LTVTGSIRTIAPVTLRVSTGIRHLDDMLGGGLLPGTLAVVYGATGIGKTHLGLTFAHHGVAGEGAPGLVFDMNARGDSQQHHAYAERLFGWKLGRWTHSVMPMAVPFPPDGALADCYSDAFPWAGKIGDYQVTTPGGPEFDWSWKASYNRALYAVRPFFYFHFCAGARRVIVDGVEPTNAPSESVQFFLFDELYRKVIHRDAETVGMEICLPVWKYRDFIDAHRYDHRAVTTLLLVTAEETRLEDLIGRKLLAGDLGAVANTILAMGSERVGTRVGRFLSVVKHRGSAMSDEIVEYRITERGVEFR